MTAKVLAVEYQFGGYERGSKLYTGRKIPSFVFVEVELGNKREFARVDRFFKERLGLLTSERRERIYATMPETVELVILKTIAKNKHVYGIAKADLEQWLARLEQG